MYNTSPPLTTTSVDCAPHISGWRDISAVSDQSKLECLAEGCPRGNKWRFLHSVGGNNTYLPFVKSSFIIGKMWWSQSVYCDIVTCYDMITLGLLPNDYRVIQRAERMSRTTLPFPAPNHSYEVPSPVVMGSGDDSFLSESTINSFETLRVNYEEGFWWLEEWESLPQPAQAEPLRDTW